MERGAFLLPNPAAFGEADSALNLTAGFGARWVPLLLQCPRRGEGEGGLGGDTQRAAGQGIGSSQPPNLRSQIPNKTEGGGSWSRGAAPRRLRARRAPPARPDRAPNPVAARPALSPPPLFLDTPRSAPHIAPAAPHQRRAKPQAAAPRPYKTRNLQLYEHTDL